MKTPLNYQSSEFDCAPVTFLNALQYLFEREQINPELIKIIYQHSMDRPDGFGVPGKCGTSAQAVQLLTAKINQYSLANNLRLCCEFLPSGDIRSDNPYLSHCISGGGVLLACVHFDKAYHYVLATEMDDFFVGIFDPYYTPRSAAVIEHYFADDNPFKLNRRVEREIFFGQNRQTYSLGEPDTRECVLMYRSL